MLGMRVLLAEDDSIIADGVARALRKLGYAVDLAENGTDADTALQSCSYDLAILDIGLPRMTGLEVLRRLRSRNTPAAPHVPVLMLTAHDAPADRVKGLDLGADDYMGKPFDLDELAARVRALIRRNSNSSPQMVCGNLTYDQVGRVATLCGQTLDLSARELGLLEILLGRMGRLVSKDQLVDHLCGWGEEVSHNAIEVYVHRLRKKLEAGGVQIVTARGLGYCLEKPHEDKTPA
jgi:two-component system, OmpR family, response regulator